ncbi:zf-HC2 domain-containing protein [Gaopeijia maritima]|uniref:Zf-HC2 domain-containing protein n=1 Tax=Gaopeijia maritima TaxID=3119007 RepID=A0ABU9EDW9_9BACT
MSTFAPDQHLSAERMQALLDGILPAEEAVSARAHLDGCARCRSEVEAWEALFDDLQELPVLTPSPTFRHRILESAPTVEGSAARRRLFDAHTEGHVDSGVLQDHLEGRLAARVSARIDAHLDGCAVCRDELAAFRSLSLALDDLAHVEPTPYFTEQVMATWRVEQLTKVAMAPTTRSGHVAAWIREHLPSSRQGWAVAFGLSTVPAIVTMLVFRAVFASPLVTVGNLLAFLRLKTADALSGVGGWADGLLQSAGLAPMAASALEAMSSPVVAASVATLASGSILAAMWVVYRFLIASQPADRPYAHSR